MSLFFMEGKTLMRIEFCGVTYEVYWKYLRNKDLLLPEYKAEFTECHIEALLNGANIITTARKAPQDSFNKEVGRKISLDRALKQLFPNNKYARSRFWRIYFDRTNSHLARFGIEAEK